MDIRNYEDFCRELLESGFSMGGGDAKGIYAAIPFGWEEQDYLDTPVRWHTGDPETDPWQWRMRVLEERGDVAYAKLFFRASGYITREWYPRFYAVRRGGDGIYDAYESGNLSIAAKRIYDVVAANGETPTHELKRLAGFGRSESSAFERALTELQAMMFLTISGRTRKVSNRGESYGWDIALYDTVENFWSARGAELPKLDPLECRRLITGRVRELNPLAEQKRIDRFIDGH